jgi:hypothetical protein
VSSVTCVLYTNPLLPPLPGSAEDLSAKATQSSILKQREKEETALKAAADGGKQRKRKPPIAHSKFHGDAPVDLMTQFLALVSSNQMQAALDYCPKILEFEPDNILIKMYVHGLG